MIRHKTCEICKKEFDGDYWHGENSVNKERDHIREQTLHDMGYTDILHIKECDYKNNPLMIVNKCLDFIQK